MGNEMSANPFQSEAPSQPVGATANTDQQRAIAEVQAAMAIARMNPRDPIAAVDRILNACTRPTLAETAIYQYQRAGTDISGPSIRLAETVAQNWGNIQFGIRELEQRNGESVVQAYAWDVETNTRREMTFTVPHIRRTKRGSKILTDPREIYEMVANQGARRLRACILSVIPGDVIEAAVGQCETTLRAHADTSDEAIQKMLDAFRKFGVSKAQIESRIQRRLDAIQPAQMVQLKKIYSSLRDGMSQPSDWFYEDPAGQERPESGTRKSLTSVVKEKIKAVDTEVETSDRNQAQDAAITYAEIAGQINAAKSDDDLSAALDLARDLPEEQRAELEAMASARMQAFSE